MLSDKLRDGANSKGFKTLLALIVVSFVLTGVGGYLIPKIDTDPVKVGDLKISNAEWTEQYNRRAQQLRQYGAQADELLENPEYTADLKRRVLEGMIDNLAFHSAVREAGISVGDEQVREVIRNTPAFRKDGKFDNDLYLATVRNMGMNPEYFGEQLRISLIAQSVSDPVMNLSSLPLPYEIRALAELLSQRRTVDLYTADTEKLAEGITVSEEEAKAYFDSHHKEFMAPATVRFTYLLLSLEDLKDKVKVSDTDLEEYYNMYRDDFAEGEQRRVSHILIRKDTEGAAQKVIDLEKELASGADFAALAEKYSDDNATKNKGGDMGNVSKGQLAADIDSVLFAMSEKGQVSKKIEDDYGTHFIKLTEIIPAHTPALSEIRNKVRIAYVNAKATELFNNNLTTMSDLSFENPDSLDVTADALKLKIRNSGLLKQGDTTADWPLNTEAVQKLAFDEDIYTSGINSHVINIDEEHSLVLNVSDHTDAALKDFADVKEQAEKMVRAEKLSAAGIKILEDLGNALEKDPDLKLPADIKVEKDVVVASDVSSVSPAFGRAVMALPTGKRMSRTVADNNGVQTLAVLKKTEKADEQTVKNLSQLVNAQLMQIMSQSTQDGMYRRARELNEIEYNQDAINLVIRTDNGDM